MTCFSMLGTVSRKSKSKLRNYRKVWTAKSQESKRNHVADHTQGRKFVCGPSYLSNAKIPIRLVLLATSSRHESPPESRPNLQNWQQPASPERRIFRTASCLSGSCMLSSYKNISISCQL